MRLRKSPTIFASGPSIGKERFYRPSMPAIRARANGKASHFEHSKAMINVPIIFRPQRS